MQSSIRHQLLRWALVLGVLVLVACKPRTPDEYIQPGEMEDLLVEYHLSQAMANHLSSNETERTFQQSLYLEALLKEHDVTRAQFDSSLVYYYTHADRFTEMYERVADRLEKQAKALGVTEGEISKYAAYNASGDTANIWVEQPSVVLMPLPAYQRWEFCIDSDSTFHRGDSFLLNFMADVMYREPYVTGIVLLAVTLEGDTTISRYTRFTTSGLIQLRFDGDMERNIRHIRGFFYVSYNSSKVPTTPQYVFLNNVQLIRFHKTDEEIKKDSITRAAVRERQLADTLGGGDTLGRRRPLLSPTGGAPSDRVVERMRPLNAR